MAVTLQVVSSDRDVGRMLAIRNAIDPRPLTVAGWRAERTVAVGHLVVVATDGPDLGAGEIGWGASTGESGIAIVDVWVLPGFRGRGVGRALFGHLVDFARSSGMTSLRARVLDGDAESLAFATRRGFRVAGRGQEGALDLSHDDPPPPDPVPGIEIKTLAERPDLDRAAFDLFVRVRPEIPVLVDEPESSFEAWRADSIGDPGFLPGLSLLALDGTRVVGMIETFDNSSGVVFIGMTAVDPDYRRRGVARLLKSELSRRAKAAGVVRIETYNDGTNERIRALNESLGYSYLPWKLMLRAPIPESDESGS